MAARELTEYDALADDLEAEATRIEDLRVRCAELGVEPPAGGDPLYYAARQLEELAEAARDAGQRVQWTRRDFGGDLGPEPAARPDQISGGM